MDGETDKQPEHMELVQLIPLMWVEWVVRLVEARNDNVAFI